MTTNSAINSNQLLSTGNSPTFAGLTISSSALSGTNFSLGFTGLADGNYINVGTGGRNIGVFNNGPLFITNNLDYNATTNTYVYNATAAGCAIELGTTGTGSLKYIASGTAGANASLSTALSWNSSGTINISGLAASSLVATDGSSNLGTSTSTLSPTFAGMTLSSTGTVNLQVTSTTTGSANQASLTLTRGDSANGTNLVIWKTGVSILWSAGMASGTSDFVINDVLNSIASFKLTTGTGAATVSGALTTGGTVTLNSGNLVIGTATNGITLKGAAVSAGTANASFVTSVVLVGGTVTVNNSFVTTSCCGFCSVVTSGGTPGVGYIVTVASGTFTVKSTNALDTSTLTVCFIKGN